MKDYFSIKLPEQDWKPISDIAKNGKIVFIRDGFGHVDLAIWDNGKWNYELGICEEPTHFYFLSIDYYR